MPLRSAAQRQKQACFRPKNEGGAAGNRQRAQVVDALAQNCNRRFERYFAGRSVSFCTRQLPNSPTNSSFSLRQSIELTMLNSFGTRPARPNLPTILPSNSIL